MPCADTEDQLVERPAIGLFAELGWSTVPVLDRLPAVPSRPNLQPSTRQSHAPRP